MSESYFLESKATGTWEYEIQEGKIKVNYPINLGFNEIPESHRKTLEDDPGYQARIKKGLYKEMKQKGGRTIAENAIKGKDTKAIEAAKDAKEARNLYKGKVVEMKKELDAKLKFGKTEFHRKLQDMIELRTEALSEVKVLKDEKLTMAGEHSGIEAGLKKDLEISKGEFNELIKGLEKELSDLKLSSEKKIKSLEGENKALEAQVKNLKKAK